MARKKKRKKIWLRILLLFIFVPLTAWSIAFLIWFYWYDIVSGLKPDRSWKSQPNAVRQREREEVRDTGGSKSPRERILDEDRKKLEDILKRRN